MRSRGTESASRGLGDTPTGRFALWALGGIAEETWSGWGWEKPGEHWNGFLQAGQGDRGAWSSCFREVYGGYVDEKGVLQKVTSQGDDYKFPAGQVMMGRHAPGL